MGVQNILNVSKVRLEDAETLLRHSVQKDWSFTTGFLWYSFDADSFPTVPDRGSCGLVTHRLFLTDHSPVWKDFNVPDHFPGGYLGTEVTAVAPTVARSLSPGGQGQVVSSMPLPAAPLASTGFQSDSAPAPAPATACTANLQRIEAVTQTDSLGLEPYI